MRLVARVLPIACLVAVAGCGPESIGDSSSAPSGDAGSTSAPPPASGAPPAPTSGGAPAADAGSDQGAPSGQDVIVTHDIHADALRASVVRAHDVHAKKASYRQLVVVGDKDDATGGAKDNLDQKGTVEAQEVHAHDIHVDTLEADTVYAHAVKSK
jgi:hypothetical protein